MYYVPYQSIRSTVLDHEVYRQSTLCDQINDSETAGSRKDEDGVTASDPQSILLVDAQPLPSGSVPTWY